MPLKHPFDLIDFILIEYAHSMF